MLKQILSFLIILSFIKGFSQDLKLVDQKVLKYPTSFNKPEKLAILINSDFNEDIEKVRAIYTWIANNINYDINESGKYQYTYTTAEEHKKKESIFEKKLSKRVISKKIAVCEGYSILFKILCDLSNIKCEKVVGCAKTEIRNIGNRYSSNHGWNLVFINNKEFLIDATWGARDKNKTSTDVDYFYFLTPPHLLIKTHYPDDYKHSLIAEKIKKSEYLNYPLIYHTKELELINPTVGILTKKKNTKINFRFYCKQKVEHISYQLGRKSIEVSEFLQKENYLDFKVDISKAKARKLTIFINYSAVTGFLLK